MAEPDNGRPDNAGKGKAFFDRGDQVAETGNWDFAIQMYLEGIRREPENLERGHEPLRMVSLSRKAKGGKAAGLMEQIKRRPGKDPIENLVNAEFLLAKNPGKVDYMSQVLKAAQKAEQPVVVKWVGEIILEAMRLAKRPSKRLLVMTADAFATAKEYVLAVQACDQALRVDPNDGPVQERAKNYSAQATIKQGQYDAEGSFTRSVVDMAKQQDLMQRDAMTQSRSFLDSQIERARAEYEESPAVAGKVDALVDALLKIEEEAFENEAIDVLKKAHADSNNYRYKSRQDDIKIRQMRRRYNKLRADGQKDQATQQARDLLAFELEAFGDRAVNYPTDIPIKFELGRRQLTAGQIDKAIASLQQAQRDPKRRILALNYLGQAFSKKGWHREAVETYEKALTLEPPEQRAKELHYNLATALQALGEAASAIDHFSQVVQMDYNFRDAREQIEQLRKASGDKS